MKDPVAVDLDGKFGQVVDRDYAEAMGLTILDDEPIYAHGRFRGVFRLDGRRIKPRAPRKGAKAIPTTTDTASNPAGGNADGVAVESTEE